MLKKPIEAMDLHEAQKSFLMLLWRYKSLVFGLEPKAINVMTPAAIAGVSHDIIEIMYTLNALTERIDELSSVNRT